VKKRHTRHEKDGLSRFKVAFGMMKKRGSSCVILLTLHHIPKFIAACGGGGRICH
jgi:hypothetical protein